MNDFDKLSQLVSDGLEGKNEAIPIGFKKLGKYASFRKRIFTLLFSSTGAGKSGLVDDMMLNACEYLMKQKKPTQKIKFILFSQERAKVYRIAKWTSRKIFIDHGITIPVPKLLGWWEERMTADEHDLFLMYNDYISNLLADYIDIYEGARSPDDMYRIQKEFFTANGRYENITEHKKIYIPNNENLIVVPVIDHGNLTKRTKELPSKKAAVDKLTEYEQSFRDLEGASPLWVSQVGRSMSNPMRLKSDDAELTLDDVKESGDMGDACDIAISLFDPLKYRQASKTGYNPEDFQDKTSGAKYFRSIQICKSSYGEDDLRIPFGFNGFCGQFSELPRKKDLSESQYKDLIASILNKNYFLTKH